MLPYVAKSILDSKISTLARGSEWLSGVAIDLRSRIAEVDAVLRSVEFAPPESDETIVRRWMATASNRAIRQMLLETRSQVSVANFRTRLNADLEAQRGRRHPANGSPKVAD